MNRLPSMRYSDGIRKRIQTVFGGLNHTKGARNGEIWDMKNMSSDLYPVMGPRGERSVYYEPEQGTGIQSIFSNGDLYFVAGEYISRNGSVIAHIDGLAEGEKSLTVLGDYLVILPDKLYLKISDGESGNIEAEWSGTATIKDGTYAGESADANTIEASGANWGAIFRAGDAVTISGSSEALNNNTFIIREIEGNKLVFYENTFVKPSKSEALTIKRTIPDMDIIFENENRLWGCKGSTIYASKPGDVFNWNSFDGIASDSYAITVGSAGEFTAGCSYLGYPCFFKEEHIYKVYGDKPSNYQVMGSATLGVRSGSGKSLAIAGEILFYHSRAGIMAYSGGIPQNISASFGTERYTDAVGGSDGIKYYVTMRDQTDMHSAFVYDTRYGLWHKEDAGENAEDAITAYASQRGTMYILKQGKILRSPADVNDAEGPVESEVIFADFTNDDPNRKGISKLQLRLELDTASTLEVSIDFDSADEWQSVKRFETGESKQSFYLPIIPRRCDHFRIKLTGKGMWELYSLTVESYSGSELF